MPPRSIRRRHALAFSASLVLGRTALAQDKPLLRWGGDKDGGAPYIFEDSGGKLIGFEVELAEFDGEDDHVYLLVNYSPKVAVSALVNSLKGVSSRMIRKKNYPSIRKEL